MDESQRRVSRKAALVSDHQLKLFAALAVSESVAGYVAFRPANFSFAELVGRISGPDCNQNRHSDANVVLACRSAAASAHIPQGLDSAAPDTHATNPTNGLQDKPANNAPSNTRTSSDARSNFPAPRPGYTFAERCSYGVGETGRYCQTQSYSRKYIAVEAGAARISRLIIDNKDPG